MIKFYLNLFKEIVNVKINIVRCERRVIMLGIIEI